MGNQVAVQKQESAEKENIYVKYIIPLIDGAKSGEELLYISPSTFFGYHSIGARNFEQVCQRLKEAGERGVEIKLIIDVHDCLTAKAAEGLLSFLVDGIEIKNLEGNTDIYYLLVYNKSGDSRLVEFISERPTSSPYLPNVQIRPFRKVRQSTEKMSTRDADAIKAQFYHIWENSAKKVGSTIYKYMPGYQIRQQFIFVQGLACTFALVSGLMIGIAFSSLQQPPIKCGLVILWLLATIGTSVISNLISTLAFKKLLGQG